MEKIIFQDGLREIAEWPFVNVSISGNEALLNIIVDHSDDDWNQMENYSRGFHEDGSINLASHYKLDNGGYCSSNRLKEFG